MLRLSLVAGRELRDSLVFCLLTAAEDFNGKGVISANLLVSEKCIYSFYRYLQSFMSLASVNARKFVQSSCDFFKVIIL